jgi:hypothetical protein
MSWLVCHYLQACKRSHTLSAGSSNGPQRATVRFASPLSCGFNCVTRSGLVCKNELSDSHISCLLSMTAPEAESANNTVESVPTFILTDVEWEMGDGKLAKARYYRSYRSYLSIIYSLL